MQRATILNTPNKLSLLRILLSPIILLFMVPLRGIEGLAPWNEFVAQWGIFIAAALFIFASYTDYLDGHLARKNSQISVFGQFIDPIGDKLLVLTVFIAWVELGRITSFVPVVVLLREFMVTGLRLLAMGKGKVIAASPFGKAKTVSQFVALYILFVEYFLLRFFDLAVLQDVAFYVSNIAIFISVILTLLSGLDYMMKNKDAFY